MSRWLRTVVRIAAYAMVGYYGVEAVRIAQMLLELEHDGHPAGNSIQGSWEPSLTPDNSDAAIVTWMTPNGEKPAHEFSGNTLLPCLVCGADPQHAVHHDAVVR